MPESLALKAFIFGLISAASLPLGAVSAMVWKRPPPRVIAALMAFGGGALLAALTIDLVAETVREGDFYPLAAGCIAGGVLFVVLNQLVNNQGGFLRKSATTFTYLRRRKQKLYREIFEKLSRVPLFQSLPPGEIQGILPHVSTRNFAKGQVLLRQGDPGDSLFIIDEGTVDILQADGAERRIATLGPDDVFGEMALLTGQPRSATAVAIEPTKVWILYKIHFDALLHSSPELAQTVRELVSTRIADLQQKSGMDEERAQAWVTAAIERIDSLAVLTPQDIEHARKTHGGAPLAIWLGILLDGIPESLVIGSSLLHANVSLSLLAGLFLSNYPEALSSSVGMREQHYSKNRIFWMWASLMIITGIGAWLGNVFFAKAPHMLFALVDGMAAGAMLAMIAETMLPEAYHKGGAVTGLSTLGGFLAAIFFKTLEG